MNETQPRRIVPCSSCTSLNRLPVHPAEALQAKCGKCHAALNARDNVFEVSAQALQKIVLNSPVPVVVDFWAPWCGPCLAFAPTFVHFAGQHPHQAIYLKCDTEAHPQAGTLYNIRSIPTLLVFENEKEKARQSGALPLPALKQWLGSQFPLG